MFDLTVDWYKALFDKKDLIKLTKKQIIDFFKKIN